jgi:hypothetical protein
VEKVDCEMLIKSMVFMADGVAETLGENGARAAMRQAGHRAATNLLDALPLRVSVPDALVRACPIIEALGLASDCHPLDERHIAVKGNTLSETVRAMGMAPDRHPAGYYALGLFEGLIASLTKTRVRVVRQENHGDDEVWAVQT